MKNRFRDSLWHGLMDWFRPRSAHHEERFQERNLRVIVLVGSVIFGFLMLISVIRGTEWQNYRLYVYLFSLCAAIVWAIRTGRITLAGRLAALSSFGILLDSSVAYWSPGTVALSLVFTFSFLLILPVGHALSVSVLVNIGIYLLVAITAETPSPLMRQDFYSEPVSAIISTILGHVLILSMGIYIRRDQAERDRQALLIEQEKVDFLREFMRNISHDLRTPLTNIHLSMYFINRLATPEQQPRIEQLEKHLQHLESSLIDMLEMSRLDAGIDFEPHVIDILPVLQQVQDDLEAEANSNMQTLNFRTGSESILLLADANYLRRGLVNVVENALMYTPESATVDIRAYCQGAWAVVEIKDSGIGIPADDLPHVFERFFRGDRARSTATGKSGLGLTITRRIVEIHQGEISISSKPDAGTTVCIKLPLA